MNQQARSLASGSSNTVGLLVHEIGDPYFSEIASGVMTEAARLGVSVHLAHAGRDPEAEIVQAKLLIASGVSSIIVAGSGLTDPDYLDELGGVLRRFQQRGGTVSLIGRHNFNAASVRPDNVAGGRAVTNHLLDLGHVRLGLIRGNRELTAIVDRLEGIEAALADRSLKLADLPVYRAPFHREGGSDATLALMRDHPEVTAILALNDAMAVGALSALKSLGISIPAEVSVAGFNDISVARDLSPSLTTVRFDLGALGSTALRNALSGEPASETWLSHELCVRESTAVPRA
ncbi:substrate-binding domain-containing protein [Tessaracoccus sp. OS52]|uniref:LacI family DNA-binding transcriptional regulator n=1 Tax=Tessaracoccus sp. OS52 TaxID=2886691 RepID=UPI001D113F3C|nr:substrate-binding domain-containing protein [Tessaracoccus sp. OS52]